MKLTRKEAFDTLELPIGADMDSVKMSYKRLALTWHPDKHQNSAESLQKFKQVSVAYRRLQDNEYRDTDDIEMSLADTYDLFQQIFFSQSIGDDTSSDDENDEEEEDTDQEIDYLSIFASNLRTKNDFKNKKEPSDENKTYKSRLTADEIEKNAKELIIEEDKEKRKAEKRRAKKKRQREKKRADKVKEEQKSTNEKDIENSTQRNEATGINGDIKTLPAKKDTKSKDNSDSEEEFDPTSAFFTKVISKKKSTNKTAEPVPVIKKDSTNDTKNPETQKRVEDDETEDLDPVVLKSRQLAIRGNEMANLGHYTASIDLFTEAIRLDSRDFRFFGNRSYCYDRMQQYDKAMKDAERAIKLAPDWPKGYFRKGRALAGLQHFADAEQSFMQVLKLDRHCEDALQELVRVRSHQLMEMGFSRQQAEGAIRQYGTVQTALDSLLAGVAENTLTTEVYQSDDDDESFTVHKKIPQKAPVINKQVLTMTNHQQPEDVSTDPRNPHSLTSLWVGNVLPEVSEKNLMLMFSKYAPVTSCRIINEKFCAFVNFSSHQGASVAMDNLQGADCCGQHLLIKFPDNPITNGDVVVKKAQRFQNLEPKQSGPVNGDECYFWRTTGCQYGNRCHYKHVPGHKHIDKKPWHHSIKE